ncbi:MAG: GNAT family N-acetyltransferase [Beijerinckiaceae bacterium]
MDANQQIAIRLLQAIDEKDWEGVSGAFAADAEYRPPAQQARVGRAAIERYYREERPVILGLHRVDEILSGDGITVVTGEFVGESQGGRRTCAKFIDILRIHDGAIIDREVMTRPLGETPFQPPLVTDRLLLRPFTLTDVEGLVRIGEGGFIADTTITVPHPLSTESARHWLIDDLTRCSRAQKIYAVEDRISSTLVGSVGFRHIDEAHRQGELTFWFGPFAAGRGFAAEAARALLEYGWAHLALERVEAYFMRRNSASGRVLEKLGFFREAILKRRVVKWGVTEDVELWALLRSKSSI